ncbi:hypothetical protein [Anaerovibrio sp. RM50]|uniref:hypothetical protein n=1 Tax=Anaerovibrio sp. RM50 TaxID=1200557 RepID=UPI00047FF7B8|nr:hypothetical protein [Anaerovibrio sp. RM50]
MKYYILLHIMLLIYSTSGIFSKLAAGDFLGSSAFFACYAGMLAVLFVYAIGWQQVIKHMPLSVAFANRPVTIVWGMLWGYVVFGEQITTMNIIGAFIIVLGIEVYLRGDKVSGHE